MCDMPSGTHMHAQRCAVLGFKAVVGISQADVDGISAIFITYFRPAGYTMVERTQIDKAIDEQGFQRSKMTESQMVRTGKILNVSKIVIGDVNIVMGQYNVDTRVINVESGTIAATEGATFTGSSYRTTMQSIAQKLSSKITITPGSTIQQQPQQDGREHARAARCGEQHFDDAHVVAAHQGDHQQCQEQHHDVQADSQQLIRTRHLRWPVADEQQVLQLVGILLNELVDAEHENVEAEKRDH